ncbi:MAG: ABC transporter substrate-binding protein [Spirochaetae bacterium HGW-Spirochaetae-3]|nr:MAG: ABC transporter substrate-binding protein [Spirochaetae bacterium HGW-Spirochaetae-3]
MGAGGSRGYEGRREVPVVLSRRGGPIVSGRRTPPALTLAAAILSLSTACGARAPTVLRYAHMNARDSVAGIQADFFAERAAALSDGRIRIEVYPASSLGSLSEQLEMVRDRDVDIHHTTAGALGSLFEDFSVLDTPYLVSTPDRLMRIADRDSPLMRRLGDGLEKASGLSVLYTFYFGARQLTFDAPVLRPEDLAGARVRAIPFPMYELAVEALGGVPTPIDWNFTPTALATGLARGQENPPDTILAAKLYQSQSYLMLTNHILGAQIVVVNRRTLSLLPKRDREALFAAGREAGAFATRSLVESEAEAIAALRDRGMRVVSEADGLDVAAFKARAARLVAERLGDRWVDYYALIDATP